MPFLYLYGKSVFGIIMKHLIVSLLAVFMLFTALEGSSQCASGEVNVEIVIVPDAYPNEISWELRDINNDVIADGGAVGAEVCVEENACLVFDIDDSYGDGIFNPGGYWLYIDGNLVAQGNNYGYGEFIDINCPPGYSCTSPVNAVEGNQIADWSDFWYVFSPETTGMYLITTCGNNNCDTRVWVYDYCDMNNFDDSNEASIYYDDNEGGCGQQAQINALLEGGHTYYIRIGDSNNSCGDLAINWNLTFNGPPVGCMDPVACNYTPLAAADDGSCVYPGDPNCTGPDLVVVESAITNSLYGTTIDVNESDCYINEGCLNGYGTREIIRFTTHIKNTGDIDYYIGPAGNQTPGQFEFDNCHNHWHYEGYARYDLFDMDNNLIPIGFKNGFCVLDLECSGGGTAQYGCGNMGISAGCGDIYGAGLNCQWLDVTDVPDGMYSLIVRVNWDYTPDALGRFEMSYDNNWAQVCIDIDRSNGFEVTQIEGCPVYVDCMGVEYGNALADCNGDCNGTALMGDLDANGSQEYADAFSYVQHILGDDIEPTTCNDLNQNDNINVTDAALMALCQFYNEAHTHPDSSGIHSKCDFPVDHIVNPFDTVWFSIGNVNWVDQYLDVHVLNPFNKIVGYQMKFDGIEITDAVSLYDPLTYPIEPSFALGGDMLIGLSYEDSTVAKNYEWTPLVRLYIMNPMEQICLSEIIDIVNEDYQNTLHYIVDGCVSNVGVSEQSSELGASAYPNPFNDFTTLRFANPSRSSHMIELVDMTGRIVRTYNNVKGTEIRIEKENLQQGSYFFRISGANNQSGRLVIE
jgi:hypothetical protein